MQVLPTKIPESFKITDQYVWLPDMYTLPATISYDVICGSESDEFLPCFSFTRSEWDSASCDALSWYASPHRDDFTFRTDLFRDFPKVDRLSPPFKPAVGAKFSVSCSIDSTSATYSINGKPYAKATYSNDTIPIQGYFGFAKYQTENITVENVKTTAKSVLPPASDADKRILVNALVNMLEILGVLLSGQSTIITKVTQSEAETMIRNAITAYRQTPSLNSLSLDQVHAAIDRVYNKVYSDVSSFFDEEIAEQSLMAASQAAMAAGSIFSFFPLVSVICDGAALATMATALGLEIDLEKKGPKIVTEANSLKTTIDQQPELAPAKVWNDARSAEILTLGRLNAGMASYRGDSSLYSLIYVIDVKTPGLTDDQLFDAVKKLCIDTNDLAAKLPNLGDKLYAVVSAENPTEIKQATEAMTEISQEVAQLVGAIIGTVVFGAKLSYNVYKNYNSIKTSWNAIEGDPIPEGMEGRWTKTMTTCDKISAGVGAIAGVFGASMEIWQAIKTTKQKDEALKTITDNRDSIKEYYDSVLSHVH
ncbi:hypothetical protein [Aquimarina spongiae]|uniref:Uncharacterized protein n=1 Tax=Aquimarina spongiae TaxID=570521 RepID=A0A1M6BJS3_9FLAO|nr:hypothetical protein [Aquimarina spongiae]SHI48936.1 hypothetical protein SAMN04488508_101872 [Aquimarina spongiae]